MSRIPQWAVKNWPILLGIAVLWFASDAVAHTSRAATKKKLPTLKPWPETSLKRQWLLPFAAIAVPILHNRGFPASVALGMAATESGYGSAMPDNPWGVRGKGDAGTNTITTQEDFGAGKVTLPDQKFAKYSTVEAATNAYCDFLSGTRYRNGWSLRDGADDGLWLLWLWGMGYASGSGYAQTASGASRRIAVELDDPEFVVTWDANKAAMAKKIGAKVFGKARREETVRLLSPYLTQSGVL